jgi:hypothetical protein
MPSVCCPGFSTGVSRSAIGMILVRVPAAMAARANIADYRGSAFSDVPQALLNCNGQRVPGRQDPLTADGSLA